MNVKQMTQQGSTNFESFRLWVLDNPEVQSRLREILDVETFITAVLEIAVERGYHFSRQDIEAIMQIGDAAWLQRWMPW